MSLLSAHTMTRRPVERGRRLVRPALQPLAAQAVVGARVVGVRRFRQPRPARDVVLSRLLEVLFIEALRATAETAASPGLVRGLADARVADALRAMHERPSHAWTVAELADVAALSRSAFFERFGKTVGVAPMAYLLAWRMGLAKQWLRQGQRRIAEVAERVGYRSASAFSVAFTRCVGQSPGQYARGDG